jgi:UPF0716 protein FxsA
MPLFRLLFILFLTIPLIEIYLLIQVGEVIGAGWTIFLVVGTAVIGAALLRLQGLATLYDAQRKMAQGELPATALIEGVMLLLSGALLLTPGFFTDTLGFLVLIPPLRRKLARFILSRGVMMGASGFSSQHWQQSTRHQHRDHSGKTIEGDYKRRDDE